MDKFDWLEGLHDIGEWTFYSWGQRWVLTNDEVKIVTNKIDVIKNGATIVAAVGGLILQGTGVGTMGLVPAGASAGGTFALYEAFKARLKSANRGNGVIVDLPLGYLNIFQWIPGLNLIFQVPSMNFCNIQSR